MRRRVIQFVSWLAGIGGFVGIVWYFGPESLGHTLAGLGAAGIFGWVLLTLLARLLLVETAVLPLDVLGFRLGRAEAFWIGCLRTFANQIVPLTGVAAFAQLIRRRLRISWSELAALAAPQFVLALAALGLVGMIATAANISQLGSVSFPLGALYIAVFVIAISVSTGAAWIIESMPSSLASRAANTATALRKMTAHSGLVAKLLMFHGVTIIFRGGRIWILFAAAGTSLDWSQMLLLLAIAESTMLLNITPGGLGVREGAILGGAALVGVPTDVAAGIAITDRIFLIAITVLLTPPALVFLKSEDRS